MNSKLIVISPTAPPAICGVSDYALNVSQELAKFYESVEVGVDLIPENDKLKNDQSAALLTWEQLLDQTIESKEAADVFLNYTPTSYSWTCWPRKLITTLKKFKSTNPKNKFFIFFHETWNGSSDLKFHHKMQARITRWSMYQLGKLAEGIAVINNEQKQKIETLLDRTNVRLNQVGSNILPLNKDDGINSKRQSGVWVIFGLPHTRFWAIQNHIDLIKDLYNKGILVELRTIGPVDSNYAVQEAGMIRNNLGEGVIKQLGSLSSTEVSEQMLIAGAAIVGLNANGLHKSGSFAALAAHGVPVVCGFEITSSNPYKDLIFNLDQFKSNSNIINSPDGELTRKRLHEWFWSNRSWTTIGQELHTWFNNYDLE